MYSGNIDPSMLSKLIPGLELEYMGEGIQRMYAEDAAQCRTDYININI